MQILPARAGPAAHPAHSGSRARGLFPRALCCSPSLTECGLQGPHAGCSASLYPQQHTRSLAPGRGARGLPAGLRAGVLSSLRDAPCPLQTNPGHHGTLLEHVHPAFPLPRNVFCIPSFNPSMLATSPSPPRPYATRRLRDRPHTVIRMWLATFETHTHTLQGDKGDTAFPRPLKAGTGAEGVEDDWP